MLKVLLIGDIHIGRRPRRLPEDLADHQLSVSELTPAAAWHAAVRFACDQDVDAVLLAGDVVEFDNYMFEAFGHVDKGVKALLEAGIPVLGVAGNHDVGALPRLAKVIPEFQLVGAGGKWECLPVRKNEKILFHLLGWSFPKREVTGNPFLEPMPELPNDHHPVFGIIHADLGASSGSYAPVRRADLENPLVSAWFLGHIHKPSAFSASPHLGYLGSLVGLDPGETGQRGPWLLTVSDRGSLSMEHIPLSPLRWERVVIPVDNLVAIEDLPAEVTGALEKLHHELNSGLGSTRLVGCRLVFTGRTALHKELRRIIEEDELRDIKLSRGGTVYFIEKLVDECVPQLDLESIARGSDPPGLLARHLKGLQEGEAESIQVLGEARRQLERELNATPWFRHESGELSEEYVKELLLRAATLALEDLLPAAAADPGDGEDGR